MCVSKQLILPEGINDAIQLISYYSFKDIIVLLMIVTVILTDKKTILLFQKFKLQQDV